MSSEIQGRLDPEGGRVATADSDEMASYIETAPAPPIGGLADGPFRDLGPKPEFHPALAEVDYRPGHVGVSVLVDAHRVVTRDAKDLGDAVSVDEVIDDNRPGHAFQITSVLGSVRSAM